MTAGNSFNQRLCPVFLTITCLFITTGLSVPDNLRALCPKDIALDPKYVWTYGSLCLQISMDKHDWPHARERCQRHGGDLVQIRTAEMQGSIIEKIRETHSHIKKGFWIGASDQHHEGVWEWVSGDKSMTYDNWSPHQGPHQTGFLLIHGGATEDCGLLNVDDNYMWHDYPCHSGIAFFYPYICQYEIPQPTTPTTTTTTTTTPTTATTKSTQTTTTTTALISKSTTERTEMTTPTPLMPRTTKSSTSSLSPTTHNPTRSTKQRSTFLSMITSSSRRPEVTEENPLIPIKSTPKPHYNKPTTAEWEALITENNPQDRETTTTAKEGGVEGMIIIG